MNKVLMQGNVACVMGAISAGMRFFAGYPITPSTEIAETAALELPKIGGRFIQMEDEISSMAAVIGASAAGVRAMTATSGPGFSLKQENLGLAIMAELPCVVVNVQRTGPSTGLPTSPSQGDVMQARWGTHGDHSIVALSPGNVFECFKYTRKAFELADRYMTPVIFLMDEIVGHMREGIIYDKLRTDMLPPRSYPASREGWLPYRPKPITLAPQLPPFGEGYRYHITGLTHSETGFPTSPGKDSEMATDRLSDKIEKNKKDICIVKSFMLEDADYVLVGYGGSGKTCEAAVEVARSMGIKLGLFRPITIWPFPEDELIETAQRAKHIIVVEHNKGQLVLEIERLASKYCPISLCKKTSGGTIMPHDIVDLLKEVIDDGR